MNTINNVILFRSEGDISCWEQNCQPIGNGYLGASMFGGIKRERVVLNEKTLWTGGPSEKYRPNYRGGNKPDSVKYVKEVQKKLYEGDYDAAVGMLDKLTGETDGYGAYQLLGDLIIEFSEANDGAPENYSRALDLDNSLWGCEYTVSGKKYTRKAFASYPKNVIAFSFACDAPDSVSFTMTLDNTQSGAEIYAEGNTLVYKGALEDNGLKYCGMFRVACKSGSVSSEGGKIAVEKANDVTVLFSAATDYCDNYPVYRNGTDPFETVQKIITAAGQCSFDELYAEHLADYKKLYDRAAISFNGECGDIPDIDTLFEKYRSGDKKAMSQLEILYFQFGRYMLISSSRDGSLPANLQGVWNESNCPPWCCDYHINVNLQMNYWGAYSTNLADTAHTLVEYLDKMRPAGRITAKDYYGIESTAENPENGWIAHTQSTPFGWTAPGWDFYWGWSTAAVAWLMQNIWEYYEFTGDKEYLAEKIYPIMRESAVFYKQWLIYNDKQERLVSTPTYSPEHGPVTVGNTYEQCLIEQLFIDFVKASEILGTDEKLREEISAVIPQLKPFGVNRNGLLKEWFEEDDPDFDHSKTQPNHRHISHLLALYPGKQINHARPELMEAAINTLNDRGDESTGWARAYKLCLWARVKDGNRAHSILRGLISGCTFHNLFDFHPPFQLDGNFGGSAGIAEMLIQSHEGYTEILPALPDCWSSGSFRGLCGRNGFVYDCEWEKGTVKKLRIYSSLGGALKLKTNGTMSVRETKAGDEIELVF